MSSATTSIDTSPSFGDVVRLTDSRIGRIRFIGHTGLKKNTLFYGIHLKEKNGKHDGKHYFQCPKKHGIFVEQHNIAEIIKKHTISNTSFSYNQQVKVSNIGKGKIKYIGMTHFCSNYWYGVKLENNIKKRNIHNDHCVHCLKPNQINIYFNADYTNSIFVRPNRLQYIAQNTSNCNKKHKKMNKKQYEFQDLSDMNDIHVNKSLLAMMNTLNIPQKARPAMMNMDKSKKILLIKQWFVTPPNQNHNRSRAHSEPLTPSNSNQMEFDGCFVATNTKRKRIKKNVQSKKKKKGKKKIDVNKIKHVNKTKSKAKSKSKSKPMRSKSKSNIKKKKKPKGKSNKKATKITRVHSEEYYF